MSRLQHHYGAVADAGCVEGFLRSPDDVVRFVVGIEDGIADVQGRPDALRREDPRQDFGLDPLQKFPRAVGVGVREVEHHFVGSESAHHVVVAHQRLQDGDDVAIERGARRQAVRVDDLLEIGEVEERDREGLVIPAAPFPFLREARAERGEEVEAGILVHQTEPVDHFAVVLHQERHRAGRGEAAQEIFQRHVFVRSAVPVHREISGGPAHQFDPRGGGDGVIEVEPEVLVVVHVSVGVGHDEMVGVEEAADDPLADGTAVRVDESIRHVAVALDVEIVGVRVLQEDDRGMSLQQFAERIQDLVQRMLGVFLVDEKRQRIRQASHRLGGNRHALLREIAFGNKFVGRVSGQRIGHRRTSSIQFSHRSSPNSRAAGVLVENMGAMRDNRYTCHMNSSSAPSLMGMRLADYARWMEQHESVARPAYSRMMRTGDGLDIPEPTRAEEQDGVRKFCLPVPGPDGHSLETESVIIPMNGHHGNNWMTLCVSSQVGCRMACSFCENGGMGLLANLDPAAIVAQRIAARRFLLPGGPEGGNNAWRQWRYKDDGIANIVFMGMGEPLDNFDAVVHAISVLSDPAGLNFPVAHITISTVGRIDGIRKLAALGWRNLRIAVSLNAARDDVRNELMPINRGMPLAELQRALIEYPLGPKGRYCIEYVLMKGVNDSASDADLVAEWCRPLRCIVNVIPYNPQRDARFAPPSDDVLLAFMNRLKERGQFVKRRVTHGRDLMGACGQLGNSERRRSGASLRPAATAI